MSRPAVSELAPVEPSANVEQVEEVSADVSPELIRRVVFECNSTGSELANGVVVNLNNAGAIFTPSMAADLSAEEKAAFEGKGLFPGYCYEHDSQVCPLVLPRDGHCGHEPICQLCQCCQLEGMAVRPGGFGSLGQPRPPERGLQ